MMMLDPNTVQVLFADLQPQIVARSKTNPPEALARSAAVLAQVARLLQLPMHLSVVPPEEVKKPIFDGVEKDFKRTVRATFDGQLPEKTDAEVKEWLKTKAEGQDPKMALALMRDLFGLDTRKLLKEAKVPVRCINSAGGYKSFTPTVVETNKKYADFGAVTIDGVGHYPMLEKPDEFNRKLRDVLKEFATKK